MKLLFCQQCGDIIAPKSFANHPRFCECRRHAVWWVNPSTGVLRVHDADGPTEQGPAPMNRRAFVIGLHNHFLQVPGAITKADVEAILADTPDTYIFKRIGSCVIRIRPGESSDTGYAPLPDEWLGKKP